MSENLINFETNRNVDISKKTKEVGDKNQDLIEAEHENTVIENGLTEDKQKELVTEDTNEKKDQWEDLLGSGCLMKKIIKHGEPDTRPQRLEKCLINYECKLENGTVVEEMKDFEMLLGDCEVRYMELKRFCCEID